MQERRQGRISITRGMAGAAMKGRTVSRRCKKCGLAMPYYPGRYPSRCPTCGGDIEIVESERGAVVHEPVIVCVSRVPRLQRAIDAGAPAAPRGPRASNTFVARYEDIDRTVPGGGVERLTAFMEGPIGAGLFYRVESPGDPVVILELDDAMGRASIFASDAPAHHLGFDPRTEFVETGPVGEGRLARDAARARARRAKKAADQRKFHITWHECEHQGDLQRYARAVEKAGGTVQHMYLDDDDWDDGDEMYPETGSMLVVGPANFPKRLAAVPGARGFFDIRGIREAYLTERPAAGIRMHEGKRRGRQQQGAAMSPYGGFRIHVGQRQTRRPRKDIERALQSKRNQKRGLAKRIAAAKEWHRSPEGQRLHRALGRYNRRPSGSGGRRRQQVRMGESIRTWRPTQHLIEATAQYAEGIDDVLDNLLRKLLVIESLDILQDVEFDEASGSVYLFFDPSIPAHEMDEVVKVMQTEYQDLGLVASPDGSLDFEEDATTDWWVAYLPRAREGEQPPPADPDVYATREELPGPPKRQQIVVPAPQGSAEQMADEIDLGDLFGDFAGTAEAVRRLPARIQERLKARMRAGR